MSRALDDLSAEFKPIAFELIARFTEAGIAIYVVDTLRTKAEQEENLRKGTSWTKNSLHLPDATGKSNAIDVVPYEQYLLHGPDKLRWNSEDPIWQQMGIIGEKLGLRWGGRWQQKDMGHFEYHKK